MIELKNVTKKYKKIIALDGVSMTIKEKGIYCLLGKNGAGKTTLMKLIAGHVNASEGSIFVNHALVATSRIPIELNFIEGTSDHFNMKVKELINAAYSVQNDFDILFAIRMADKFRLNMNFKYKELSFGMQTMISAIIGLASDAEIIILDEPALGFDAHTRLQFYNLLQESYRRKPKIIIISTHLIDEISKVAEKLIIIDRGRIILETNMSEIDIMAYSLSGPANVINRISQSLNILKEVSAGDSKTIYVFDDPIIMQEGILISSMALQDFFLALT